MRTTDGRPIIIAEFASPWRRSLWPLSMLSLAVLLVVAGVALWAAPGRSVAWMVPLAVLV